MTKEEREKVMALIQAGNLLCGVHRGREDCLQWERAVEAAERLVRVRFDFRFELESSGGLGIITHSGHFLAASDAAARNLISRSYPEAKSLAVWTNLDDRAWEGDGDERS